MLPSISSLSPPPPPPPPPPEALVAKTLEAPPQQQHSTAADGLNPSLLIISAIILFVAAASASIHLLLRYLSRQSQPPSPLILHRLSSSSSSAASPSPSIAGNQKALIDSLPLFSLASSLARLPKSSPDCAVCLSRFEPHDQLRLLPSCRHAFHSTCIDTWLRSSRSCPLCRDPISLNPPPSQSAPVPATASDRSGSFRLEIGSVSRRRTTEEMEAVPVPNPNPSLPPHARSYSLGSSFDYVVEEEVEAVVAAVAAHVRRASEMAKDNKDAMAPGEEVAEAAGGGRGWLKDYVDRLASSASSSFSSLRCSGRFSRRSDAGGGGGVGSWDLEGNPYRMEEDGVYSFYRWLTGA